MVKKLRFNLDEWVCKETLIQRERVEILAVAFARILESRRLSEDGALDPRDLVRGAKELNDSSDIFSIWGFLGEAINAGVIEAAEVGGKNGVIYEKHHVGAFLIRVEFNSGLISCEDGWFLIHEEPTHTTNYIFEELRARVVDLG